MMTFVTKYGRPIVLALGALMVGVGVYFGLEWLVTAGGFLAGWAAPYVNDVKLRKAAKAVLEVLSHADATPEVKLASETVAVKKLATAVGHKSP
jgi:hypothetical protein